MKNLEFITGIETIKRKRFSFVVQKDNYKEMIDFYKLITGIFKNKRKLTLQYYRILDWGVLKPEEFKKAAVWDSSHNEHLEYLSYAQQLLDINDSRIIHNV